MVIVKRLHQFVNLCNSLLPRLSVNLTPRMASVSICAICGRIKTSNLFISALCAYFYSHRSHRFPQMSWTTPSLFLNTNLTNLTNADIRNAFGVWNLTNAYSIKHRWCFLSVVITSLWSVCFARHYLSTVGGAVIREIIKLRRCFLAVVIR